VYFRIWHFEGSREARRRRAAAKIVLRWRSLTLAEAFGSWVAQLAARAAALAAGAAVVHRRLAVLGRWRLFVSKSTVLLIQARSPSPSY
jgi:hypothetical protein